MSHISRLNPANAANPLRDSQASEEPIVEKIEPAPTLDRALIVSEQIFSKLDKRIAFTRQQWTVTLVIDEAVPVSFHTRILAEGIDEQGPFFRISHFQGPTVIKNPKLVCHSWFCFGKLGKVQPGKRIDWAILRLNKFRLKSETWSRPSDRVQAMLDEIDGEASEENKEKNPTPFSFFGDKSLLSFTLELYEVKSPDLLRIKDEQPKKFEFMLELYKKHREKGKIFTMDMITRPDTWKIDKKDREFWIDNCISTNKKLNILFLLGLICMKFLMLPKLRQLLERLFIIYEISRERRLFDQFQRNVVVVKINPNNCFTWARQKLRMLDIELSDHRSDHLISISSLYADKSIKSDT
jgi:hypothetical protein